MDNNYNFMELYGTLNSIINSFPKKDNNYFINNIIFINSNDIGFNNIDFCLNIIN